MGGYTLRPQKSDAPLIRITGAEPCQVGRHSANTVKLAHESISRRHAVVELRQDGLYVKDLNSLNGTFVNGTKITRQRVDNHDTVQFGSVRYEVEADDVAPAQQLYRQFAPDKDAFRISDAGLSITSLKLRDVPAVSIEAARLATLLSIANTLTASEDEAELLDRVLDELHNIIAFDRAAVLLYDDAGQLQTIVARPKADSAAVAGRVSMTIVQEALSQGQAVLTGDAADDPRFHEAGSIESLKIRSAVCLPLQAAGGTLGALYIDTNVAPGAYSDGDLEYMGAFAVQAALAISNLQLQRRIRNEAVVHTNFARFFSPATVDAIMVGGSTTHLGGEEREVNVLFADIRGYTSLSERLPPGQVVELLNDYFPQMAEIVFSLDGTLEKYIGDAMMVVWGAPLAHEDDAARAIRAATLMQKAVADLNAWWESEQRPYRIEVGIGINTGTAVAGNIGSEQYLQYATIGDATNTASRLCASAAGGQILVSETTVARAGDVDVQFGPTIAVEVKGKSEAVSARTVLL